VGVQIKIAYFTHHKPGQISPYSNRLLAGRLWFQFPEGIKDFLAIHSVQTGSVAQPVSYPKEKEDKAVLVLN
jgi:hypothetical protein